MQQMKLVKKRDSLQKGLVVFSSETLISHDGPGWIEQIEEEYHSLKHIWAQRTLTNRFF